MYLASEEASSRPFQIVKLGRSFSAVLCSIGSLCVWSSSLGPLPTWKYHSCSSSELKPREHHADKETLSSGSSQRRKSQLLFQIATCVHPQQIPKGWSTATELKSSLFLLQWGMKALLPK